jgi:hypothetical protein
MQYTRRWRDAMELAERAHRGQTRKTGDKPYFLHSFAVAQVLSAAGADDDMILAGFLHDVPEDTDQTLVEIEDRFGSRVAFLVGGVTKASHAPDGRKYTSQEKGDATEEQMENAHSDIAVVKGADLTVNTTDVIIDQEDLGFGHWDDLYKGHERAVWKVGHYLRLGEIISARLEREQIFPLIQVTLAKRIEQMQRLYPAFVDFQG